MLPAVCLGSIRLFFGIVNLRGAYYFSLPVIFRESFEGNIGRSVSECCKSAFLKLFSSGDHFH